MKITNVRALRVDPSGARGRGGGHTFVLIDTDEGITGLGECSSAPAEANFAVLETIRRLKEALVGLDPSDISYIWHFVYRRFTFLGSRGFPTTVAAGIDIALWDLNGKALGRPVYKLLGGKLRDSVPLYANGWFAGCDTPDEYAAAAKRTVAQGYAAMKCDPFRVPDSSVFRRPYTNGEIPAQAEDDGIARIAAMREAVGPSIEILIDAHGRYNVASAIRIGRRLEPFKIAWYEEPVPPESVQALRSVREHVNVPISVGERLHTRFDFVPILEQRLADYVMPDIMWTGGISEIVRIAAMAEAYYIPVSPHNVMGPIQLVAGAHAMTSIPNFYRHEHSVPAEANYAKLLTPPIDFGRGEVRLSDRPGLGHDLNWEFITQNEVDPWNV